MKPHRQILNELQLALLEPDEVGIGLPIWLPNGLKLRRKLESHVKAILESYNYQEVDSPHIGSIALYEKSGHYPYYAESQYPPIKMEHDGKKEEYLLKPMNCPHHIIIYKSQPKSYKQLPYRIMEFGKVYRYELAGSVNGLLRARSFIQDDGHIFLPEADLAEELAREIKIFSEILKPFSEEPLGLSKFHLKLSLRDESEKSVNKYVGDKVLWDRAEDYARRALQASGMEFSEAPGEAAFYGPKIDFSAVDGLGRHWQLGSIQVDFNLPERFKLEYINDQGLKVQPVMIHRAALGSLERFIAILLESSQGLLPSWLHPEPLAILPINDNPEVLAMAEEIRKQVKDAQIVSGGSLASRLVKVLDKHIPNIWVLGDKEVKNHSVSIRQKDGKSLVIGAEQAIAKLNLQISR